MTRNKIILAVSAVTLAAGATAAIAASGDMEADEARALSSAKISLTDAIQKAESSVGGKAFEVELDDESKTPRFEVELLKDGKTLTVFVDGETGQVKKGMEDESENSEKEDR